MCLLVLSSHYVTRNTLDMRSAVVLISLVAAIAAEAPYNLPQPAPQAPTFNYPAPAPSQASPSPPAPQPNFGYQYHPASIQPAFVQPAPQPQINYQSQPAPSQPIQYPVNLPNAAPQSIGYNYPQPPQILDLRQQQPQPRYQPQPQPQPIRYTPPSTSYGLPQPQIAPRPSLPQSPVQPFSAAQPAQVYQPVAYQQQQSNFQSAYSYPQQTAQSVQSFPQLPLQSQTGSNSQATSFSSYQADSQQYNGVRGQSGSGFSGSHDALDSVVIDRVTNIIRDDEHSSAKSAGYQSLVSGVSLENAQPSLEILSFVHNSPLGPSQNTATLSSPSLSVSSSSAPTADYGLPTITANSQATSQESSSFNFLPQTRPGTSYGQPSQ